MVRDGLFTDGPPRCSAAAARTAATTSSPASTPAPTAPPRTPSRSSCPRHGTLWSWTAVTAPPPGYEGEVPFGIGIVELPEGVRVITRLTESDPAALDAGQAMEFRVVPLHADAEGNDVVTYAFAPAAP